MGGKSRKTGGVSRKLIQRLVKEQQKKAQSGDAADVESKERKEKEKEKNESGFGF